MSRECRNLSASPEEQVKLREKHLRRRHEEPEPAAVSQPVAAGVAAVEELGPEELGVLGYYEQNEPRGVMIMPIAIIEEMSGNRVMEVMGWIVATAGIVADAGISSWPI